MLRFLTIVDITSIMNFINKYYKVVGEFMVKERMFDGQQRMSDWPKEIVKYMNDHPKDGVICSQSVRFRNEKCLVRKGEKVFFVYNKNKKVFVAWNVWVHFRNLKRLEKAIFDLRKETRYSIDSGPRYIEAGIVNGQKIYEKVYIIPETEFIDFYNNYPQKMEPSIFDVNYRGPVFSFLHKKEILNKEELL